jgi:5-methylcytosine-specific restriction endonuclease McrA
MLKEGVRKLPDRTPVPPEAPLALSLGGEASPAERSDQPETDSSQSAPPPAPTRSPAPAAKLQPVNADTHSLTVTVDAAFLADLEQLKSLVSHKIPSGNLGLVLREAVRCAIQQHGKRKGAVEPCREVVRKAPPPKNTKEPKQGRDAIPAAVRRRVWKRDQARCTYVSPDGRRCESTWRLQFHHLEEHALGGPDTDDNLTLRCPPHNWYAAEQTFGREHMDQFRRGEPRTGETTDSRSSDP